MDNYVLCLHMYLSQAKYIKLERVYISERNPRSQVILIRRRNASMPDLYLF